MIQEGFPSLLGGFATVYPGRRPEKTALPAISYTQISKVGDQTHDGPTGSHTMRFQFTCHAASYEAARTLADVVDGKLGGFSGPVGTVLVENTETSNDVDLGQFPDMKSWQAAVDAVFQTKGV